MTEWHTWDEVRDELADALGSSEERVQRVDQLRRELALQRLVELCKRAGLRQVDVAERMGVSKARVARSVRGCGSGPRPASAKSCCASGSLPMTG